MSIIDLYGDFLFVLLKKQRDLFRTAFLLHFYPVRFSAVYAACDAATCHRSNPSTRGATEKHQTVWSGVFVSFIHKIAALSTDALGKSSSAASEFLTAVQSVSVWFLIDSTETLKILKSVSSPLIFPALKTPAYYSFLSLNLILTYILLFVYIFRRGEV